MLAPGIAARVGRYSLNRTSPRTGADRESANGTSGLSLAGGANMSADLGLGRLTAGVGGVAVLALVGFYLWTRQHQLVVLLAFTVSLLMFSAGGLA